MTSAPTPRRFLRVRDVLGLVPVSRATVYRAIHEGKLRARRLEGALLIEAASVDEWLASAEPVEPSREASK